MNNSHSSNRNQTNPNTNSFRSNSFPSSRRTTGGSSVTNHQTHTHSLSSTFQSKNKSWNNSSKPNQPLNKKQPQEPTQNNSAATWSKKPPLPPRTIAAAVPGFYCESCGHDSGFLHEGLRFRYKIIVCRDCVDSSPTSIPFLAQTGESAATATRNTSRFVSKGNGGNIDSKSLQTGEIRDKDENENEQDHFGQDDTHLNSLIPDLPIKIYHPDVYAHVDRYRSITKTTAKYDYLLQDSDFSGKHFAPKIDPKSTHQQSSKESIVPKGSKESIESIEPKPSWVKDKLPNNPKLPHFEAKNPHSNTFSTMKLYLLVHVLDVAYEKWGGAAELEAVKKKRVLDAMNDQITKRAYAQKQEIIIQHGKDNNIDPTITLSKLLIEERKKKAAAKLDKMQQKQIQQQLKAEQLKNRREIEVARTRAKQRGLVSSSQQGAHSGDEDKSDHDDNYENDDDDGGGDDDPVNANTEAQMFQRQLLLPRSAGAIGMHREMDLISQWFDGDDFYESDQDHDDHSDSSPSPRQQNELSEFQNENDFDYDHDDDENLEELLDDDGDDVDQIIASDTGLSGQELGHDGNHNEFEPFDDETNRHGSLRGPAKRRPNREAVLLGSDSDLDSDSGSILDKFKAKSEKIPAPQSQQRSNKKTKRAQVIDSDSDVALFDSDDPNLKSGNNSDNSNFLTPTTKTTRKKGVNKQKSPGGSESDDDITLLTDSDSSSDFDRPSRTVRRQAGGSKPSERVRAAKDPKSKPVPKTTKTTKTTKSKAPKAKAADWAPTMAHLHSYNRIGPGVEQCSCGAIQEYEEL